MSKFLVIGNVLEETITSSETGLCRRHIGGVGAIMARELALAGADVTLLTSTVPGAYGDAITKRLEEHGVRTVAVAGSPRQERPAAVAVTTRGGEFGRYRGNWPRMGGLAREIRELAPDHDWTLADMNLMPGDLQEALRHSRNLISNATAKRLAPRLLELRGQRAVTMNWPEAGSIMAHLGQGDLNRMPEHCGADTALVTRGGRGYTVMERGEPGFPVPAGIPPAGADFIGAGDAATAGLAFALASGADLAETISRFVRDLLERNAAAYPA